MIKNKRIEFSTIIRNSDYIVRDHRVHEVRIMPGVTFLDIIYRVLIQKKFLPEKIVFHNVLFKEPIATSEFYDKKINIVLEQKDNESWTVWISSQKTKDNKELESISSENLQCEIHLEESMPQKNINYKILKNEAYDQLDLDEAYSYARKSGISHYEFMKGIGVVYLGQGYLLGEIHLSELANEYSDYFYIHPAYLDSATILPGLFYYKEFDNYEHKPSIPLHLEEFRVTGRLTDKCYVYIKKSQERVVSEDIVYINIEIYNSDGVLAAYMKNLAAKQIRNQELITNLDGRKEPVEFSKTNITETKVNLMNITESNNLADTNQMENDIRSMIAKLKNCSVESVSIDDGFYDQGLDSSDLLQITSILEDKLGQQLYPTLLFEYTNIKNLASFLEKECGKPRELRKSLKNDQIDASNKGYFYYHKQWIQENLYNKSVYTKKDRVLIFCDGNFLDNELLVAFQKDTNYQIILVKSGTNFEKIEERTYQINFDKPEDYELLIHSLKTSDIFPSKVIFSWMLLNDLDFKTTSSDIYLNKGVFPLFYICKALTSIKLKRTIEIFYLYKGRNLNRALGDAVGGFAKTIYLENPKIVIKTIEVETTSAEAWLSEFEQEFFVPKQIKIEDNKRYIRTLTRLDRKDIQNVPLKIVNNGVYLITGGMGGLGLIMSRYFTERNNVTLILTGRSPFTLEKEVELNKFNLQGSQAEYIQADISKDDDVRWMIETIKTKYGKIDGIIHCAGVIRDSMIINKNKEDMLEVLDPKIAGTINLDKFTADESLDFFLLFSSTTAIIGNIGQSDYAYANAFLDIFAEERNENCKAHKRSGKTVSINWSIWKNGGMKLDTTAINHLYETTGMIPFNDEDGMKSLIESMEFNIPNISIFKGERNKLKKLIDITNSSEATKRLQEQELGTEKECYIPLMNSGGKNTVLKVENKEEHNFSETLKDREDIAIIGISGKYPMADNLEEFWMNLKKGRDCIAEIPSDRWDYKLFYNSKRGVLGKTYSKWGGFINDVDKFDPLLFNIAPRDAEWIDPQERLFLETVWETIENAGYTRQDLEQNRKVGVFVGVMWSEYHLLGYSGEVDFIPPIPSFASIANRVSYFFDFHGPSIAVDTMCSSALTSIHLACDSIRRGDCNVAVAGGVNLLLHPNKYVQLSQAGFFSSDGRCRSFGEGGNGYVPGEGIGAVLLKPLNKAIEDQDIIYGVIKGISVNHGGRANGYYVPNPLSQTEAITDAIKKSHINPRTISYIETHGTGTALGDPIEVNALTKAFEKFSYDKQYCSIGSVKSNIGHLEAAAGIAGLTKVLLQLKNKQIVPSLHSKKLNTNIDFENSPFYVQQELTDWKSQIVEENGKQVKIPRRAALSSFGAGGANVHIIVEEYEEKRKSVSPELSSPQLLVISAKTKECLYEYARRLVDYCKKAISQNSLNEKISLTNMIFTLQIGREAMEERLAIIGNTWWDFIDKLTEFINSDENSLDKNTVIYGGPTKTTLDYRILLKDLLKSDILENLIKQRDLKRLALLWVEGITIPWKSLYKGGDVRRIAMPTYPFEKKRYWLSIKNNAALNTEKTSDVIETNEEVIQTSNIFNNIETIIIENIAKIIGVKPEELSVETNLAEYGIDSLIRIQLSNELKKIFEDEVTPQEIFNASTIRKLAEKINDQFQLSENILEKENITNFNESISDKQKLYLKSNDAFSKIRNANQNIKLDYAVDEFRMIQSLLSDMGVKLLFNKLREMNGFMDNLKECSMVNLRESMKIKPKFYHLFIALMDILAKNNIIKIKEDIILRGENYNAYIKEKGLEEDIINLKEKYPVIVDYVNLLVVCISNYHKILSGEIAVTDVMFPNGSTNLVEKIYQGNPHIDYFNQIVAENVQLYIEEYIPMLSKNEKINILELGSGTGGTSALVLKTISKYSNKVKYVYTDKSPLFTVHGKDTFGTIYPFMEFKLLDIEKEISKQGFKLEDFQIIIASNVLHATSNIRSVLQNIGLLISDGGWLILNEATQVQEFLTMTFGLLDGWWLYEDEENRIKNSPLLSLDTWIKLLEESGFTKSIGLGNKSELQFEFLQHVIIGEYGSLKRSELRKEANLPISIKKNDTSKDISKMQMNIKNITDYDEIVKSIKFIVAKSLGMEFDRLSTDVNFSEYGLDSLTRMRVINELKKVYKDLISPEDIFNQNTVGKLAKYIHGRMKSADEEIDKFELETMEDKTTFKQLPFNTSDMATKEIKPLETKNLKTKNILITGATGVLGGRLLKEYLETTDSILYCLVRSKDIEEAKRRLLTFIKVYDPQLTLLKEFNKRVIPVVGDITEPLLGIELEDYKKLVSVIDMTVNSAGKTSLHGLYDEVKDVNLNGTQNIIKFALETKQKYLIHISTIGIMGDLQLSSNPAFKESDLDLGQGFDNMGYPKSKLEAEKLIHSMSAMGLKWIIIRSGNIMGDSKTGQYPFGITKTPGVFYDYFKTAIDLGLAISSSWYFDITPIDYVSKSIVWFSTCLKNIYETYHLANPNHKTINDIIRLIQEYGYSIKFTNIKEYMKVLNSKENKYHSITTELMLFSPLGTIETEGFTYVDTTYTASVLAKAGIFCPDIDETLIKIYLDYCVQVEYLKKRAENYSFWSWQKD